ncbi:hypothetical protein AAU57_04240 [Nonlabens sp. YIK11]|uniref:lamin tail domain-containing protein n=1 Tax=Nonlabens sp. YIK11 TaxID=1453349 RepID=UPI0006DBED6C|nr:lamin tail domain-containing protein [Nonlabens sp. YIK11]KQC32622.1 hypothetical protein AAU57_04240 [Nonlabens sp. YIK11]
MKQTYSLIVMFFMATIAFAQQPIITGILDATCSGGTPKVIEIYADGEVDFSQYSLEKEANANVGFSDAQALSDLGIKTDEFVYVYSNGNNANDIFAQEFPNVPAGNSLESNVANNNGDDRVRLVDGSGAVIDQYGASGTDGTGEVWEYTDSYATRINGTGPDGGFSAGNWSFNATGSLNGEGSCNGGSFYENLFGTYTTTASEEPTINVNGSPVTGLDYFENNGPSQEGQFTVSGMNLEGSVLVSSTVFEVSLTSGAGFSDSVEVAFPSNGELPITDIYVRLPAGLTAGDYAESIEVSSVNATTQTVAVAGTVTADDPQVTISGNVDNLQYTEGNGPSTADSFTVSGLFLDASGINVAVNAPFEVALVEDGTYSTSVDIPSVDGGVDFVDVFVRLSAGQTLGEFTGTVTATANNAPDDTLDITGSVLASATCAPVGSIIITEVMQNPSAAGNDPNGEYFELYNTTANDIDIQSWVISDDNQAAETHTIATSVIVPAGGYIVIANSATPNGGLTPDYTYGNDISLGNGTDGVIISCGATVIDQVIWDNGVTFPDPTGASMELMSNAFTAELNDDGTNWVTATTPYGDGDLGTPGAPNGATASNESQSVLQFSMYPNPATSGTLNINVTNGGSVDVEIFSTLGQRVVNQKAVTTSVNISGLNTGLYIVKLTQGEASQTRKLVVK